MGNARHYVHKKVLYVLYRMRQKELPYLRSE